MSIKIEITDPTLKDEKMLVSLARFLMECAGHQMVAAPPEVQEFHEASDRLNPLKVKKLKKTVAKEFTESVLNEAVAIDENIMKEVIKEQEPLMVVNFNTVMSRLADAVKDKKLTQAQIIEMIRKHGLNKTYDLAFDGNAHIVHKINDELNQMGI